jgi:hypothetical protein
LKGPRSENDHGQQGKACPFHKETERQSGMGERCLGRLDHSCVIPFTERERGEEREARSEGNSKTCWELCKNMLETVNS